MTDTATAGRLAALTAAALATYRAHDLPVRPGFYRKGPRARRWTRIEDDLDTEARWTLIRSHPAGSGWRYRDRDRLGDGHASVEVQEAARILQACARLEAALEAAEGDLADLIGLALSLPDA